MKIVDYVIRVVRIPFQSAFHHSLAERSTTESIILEVTTDTGNRGYGECAPRHYVTGETVQSTLSCLGKIMPQLKTIHLQSVESVMAWLDNFEENLAGLPLIFANARCAIELALLDAAGKEFNQPVHKFWLPEMRSTHNYSGVVSSGAPASTQRRLEKIRAAGFRQVKVKVGNAINLDLRNLAMARAILGNDVELRVDVNGAWTLPQAIHQIEAMSRLGIQIFEQPLPAQRRQDYPRLQKAVDKQIEIVVDESFCHERDLDWFIQHGGASTFLLKISKLGGICNTLRLYRRARKFGYRCRLGCQVGETSILTAAGTIIASIADDLKSCEGAYGLHLLTHDITQKPLQIDHGGKIDTSRFDERPGWGVTIDTCLLNQNASRFRYDSHSASLSQNCLTGAISS